MTHENRYFIEYRLCGKLRLELIELKKTLLRNFPEIEQFNEPILHITLIPPINQTENQKIQREYILETIREEFRKAKILEFKIEDYGFFDNPDKKPIFLKIEFDKKIEKIRENIIKKLKKRVEINNQYEDEGFNPHIALGFVKNKRKAKEIIKFLKKEHPMNLKQIFDRVSILNGNKVLWEYDIFNKITLNRKEALKHNQRLQNIRNLISLKNKNGSS